jgi:hypothetical protein
MSTETRTRLSEEELATAVDDTLAKLKERFVQGDPSQLDGVIEVLAEMPDEAAVALVVSGASVLAKASDAVVDVLEKHGETELAQVFYAAAATHFTTVSALSKRFRP